jgi:signal transduction histidine kinase
MEKKLAIANNELAVEYREKEKRAAELVIANKELIFQNNEKEQRAEELIIANKELAFQNAEKEKRAAELIIANEELIFQNNEKEQRAAELITANKELAFQNTEKEKRAAELVIANKELIFQNNEKEQRAAELITANKELAFQNAEKEKRAAELVIANKELIFQNNEKEQRAAELIIANKELAFQNAEKEKRAAELMIAHKELESFHYISCHDLQEPLRKIQVFISRIVNKEVKSPGKAREYLYKIEKAALFMQTLLSDLLEYSSINSDEKKFEYIPVKPIIKKIIEDFKETIHAKKAVVEITSSCDARIMPLQFRQMMHNLMDNSLKFSNPEKKPHIHIDCRVLKHSETIGLRLSSEKQYCHITIADNGIGFDPQYKDRMFNIFQRLNDKTQYEGTGIGLAIVKKIVENHNGIITTNGELNKGARFDIYLPSE